MYNVLIIKNRLQVDISDDLRQARRYFSKKQVPLDVRFTEIETDILGIKHSLFVEKKDEKTGKIRKWYGTDGIKDLLRRMDLVPFFVYHAVIFVYNQEETVAHRDGKEITAWTFYNDLVPDTEYIEIPTTPYADNIDWIYRAITHELVHSFHKRCNKAGRVSIDTMDQYDDNDFPDSLTGNYARNLKELSDKWEYVNTFPTKLLLDKLKAHITPMYKYFTAKEIVGLKPEFVARLDRARGYAGTPFIISSGYRTKEKNADVGGVSNSAHTKGLGVDLSVKDGATRYKILTALIKEGFNRIGIYEKHIHVDMDASLPANVIWYQ